MTGASTYAVAIVTAALVALVSGSPTALLGTAFFASGVLTGRLVAWINRRWPA